MSSGNLTVSGLLANAEVGGLCVSGEPAARAALGRIAASLLAQAGLGPPCEPPREPIEVAPHTRLLTSLGGPLLDRLELPTRVRKIELVAPFVDANASVFIEVAERWPGAEIRLRIDQRFGSLSEDLVRSAQRFGTRVRLEILSLGDEDSSAPLVHGKLFAWLSDTEATVVVGSANLSRPALKGGGNFEAVLEHQTRVERAELLARVPGVRWHKAKPEHAVGPRPGEPARPHPVGAILAECRGRQLSLRWGGGVPEAPLTVRLYRGSLAVYEATVPAPQQLWDCSRAVLNLPAGLLPDENAALRVELVAGSRIVRAGWLELADVLESPPEVRSRRRLLREVLEDPVGCEPDAVVRLLELLRRDLDLVALTAPTRVARHHVEALIPDGDEAVKRGELLELELYSEETSGRGAASPNWSNGSWTVRPKSCAFSGRAQGLSATQTAAARRPRVATRPAPMVLRQPATSVASGRPPVVEMPPVCPRRFTRSMRTSGDGSSLLRVAARFSTS